MEGASNFLTLPLESRYRIYEEIFYSATEASKDTLKPSPHPDHAQQAQDLANILVLCRQIHKEARDTWRRLPQRYTSFRVDEPGYTHRAISKHSWRNLSDIAVHMPLNVISRGLGYQPLRAAIGHLPDAEKYQAIFAIKPMVPGSSQMLLGFAHTLADSSCLKSLRIEFSFVIGQLGLPLLRCRLGTGLLKDLWTLLKPIAFLPESIKVTVGPLWGWYNSVIWCEGDGSTRIDCKAYYERLFTAVFSNMRTTLQGQPVEKSKQEWIVPNFVDEYGKAFTVRTPSHPTQYMW